ncbi:unnamed protein product [Lasius platythorax]|uniref:Set2 Rpb1 interacting domain-containing protein n=1 Tax=Lasius platythorax TaxID=488582 RepID=A0AAV2NHB2_9HYME
MMTTDRIDDSLSFALKKGQNFCNDSDDDTSPDDTDDFLSMSMPSPSMNNSVLVDESNNEFLRLTAMVRAVYLSYLHKCLLSNYITCYKQTDDVPSVEVKKCADQMELHAVRLALEATLYRQNMLRMIADIKSHTVKKKAYKKLVIFLETSKDKIDVAVQTDDTWSDLHGVDNTQNEYVTPNCEETLETALLTVNSNNSHTSENVRKNVDDEIDTQMLQETIKEESNDSSQEIKDQSDFQMMDDVTTIRNEDENSQDSLLQHMEDMFCESDDSSDLTKLIEKHSGVTKDIIDKEIKQICLEADSNFFGISQNDNIKPKSKIAKLFGECEEEEMMPDSPICIEDHLPACKERIAPWIVKYLMPFYKKRRIKDRQLFKAVAKYITDMLIIENTFPEEECVSKYIESYFKNKKFVKTKQDIYL